MTLVYTVGYEGTDIDRFVATLKSVGIETLADVRAVAVSRKKGFSKSALRERLESEGISYIHFIELGDPKPGRDAARAGKFDLFQRIYSRHLSGAVPQVALLELADVARKTPTALLCFERDPKSCHRSIVSNSLVSLNMEIMHLYADDSSRYTRNAKSIASRHPGKGASSA